MEMFHPIDISYNTYIANNGSLIIRQADKHQAGHYRCSVENGIGSGLNKIISLKVNGK